MDNELNSKFSNIFIMLLYSIMTNDINRVKHFLSNELFYKYKNIIDNNINNNEKQMYDELNIAKIDIIKKEIVDNYEIVTVKIKAKYIDYIIKADTGEYKRGNNKYRIEKEYKLEFKKLVNAEKRNLVIKCPSCGANLDINFTGVCPYCTNIIEINNFDYILTNVEC